MNWNLIFIQSFPQPNVLRLCCIIILHNLINLVAKIYWIWKSGELFYLSFDIFSLHTTRHKMCQLYHKKADIWKKLSGEPSPGNFCQDIPYLQVHNSERPKPIPKQKLFRFGNSYWNRNYKYDHFWTFCKSNGL